MISANRVNDIILGEICNTLRGVPAPRYGCEASTWRKGFRSKMVREAIMKNSASKRKSNKENKKKTTRKKYPLRGTPVVYHDPFGSVFQEFITPRVPGIDNGKVIITPDFDKSLSEFEV